MNPFRLFWPIPEAAVPSSKPAGPMGAVAWYRCGDRYGHRILLQTGEDWVEGAATLEEEGPSVWPSSPPIQQVGAQDVPATRADGSPTHSVSVWFGLGMAGRSHWSVSIQPDSKGVQFEWACRVEGTPTWLGVTYALPPDVRTSATPTGCLLDLSGCRWRLEVDAATTLLHLPSPTVLLVAPRAVDPTTCWRYAWRTADRISSTS